MLLPGVGDCADPLALPGGGVNYGDNFVGRIAVTRAALVQTFSYLVNFCVTAPVLLF